MDTNSLCAIERVVNMLMAKSEAVQPPRPPHRLRFLTRNTDKIKKTVFVRELYFDTAHWKSIALPEQYVNGDPITSSTDKVWAKMV